MHVDIHIYTYTRSVCTVSVHVYRFYIYIYKLAGADLWNLVGEVWRLVWKSCFRNRCSSAAVLCLRVILFLDFLIGGMRLANWTRDWAGMYPYIYIYAYIHMHIYTDWLVEFNIIHYLYWFIRLLDTRVKKSLTSLNAPFHCFIMYINNSVPMAGSELVISSFQLHCSPDR